jgi:hypothetical protein
MERKPFTFIAGVLLVLVVAPTPSLSINGNTYLWVAGNGFWDTPGNWSPGDGPPVNYDKAVIDLGVTVTSDQGASVSQLSVGSGDTLLICEKELRFNSDYGGVATWLYNDGAVRVQNRDGGLGAAIVIGAENVSVQGCGAIVLGGDAAQEALTDSGLGGTVTHAATHTIQGGGLIQVNLVNQGRIIANHGLLNYSQRTLNNAGGVLSASGGGNVLGLESATVAGGQINPQDGKVRLFGSTLADVTFGPGLIESDQNNFLQNTATLSAGATLQILPDSALSSSFVNLVNHGDIFLNTGAEDHEVYVAGSFTFLGTGRLVMGGEGNILHVIQCTNSESHTIAGGGAIQAVTEGAHLINHGAILANDGVLNLNCQITGNGTISVAEGATLIANQPLQTGGLILSPLAMLTVNTSQYIDLKRNFSFALIDPGRWNSLSTKFRLSGGGGGMQTVEVGGQDKGAVIAGLTDNFALAQLRVEGAGTLAGLVDLVDNGHRSISGAEALYVDILQVLPEATLDLKGLKLYAQLDGLMHRVAAGEGSLFGNGQIIDTGREKSTSGLMLLLD